MPQASPTPEQPAASPSLFEPALQIEKLEMLPYLPSASSQGRRIVSHCLVLDMCLTLVRVELGTWELHQNIIKSAEGSNADRAQPKPGAAPAPRQLSALAARGGRCFAFPLPAGLPPGRAVTSALHEDRADIYLLARAEAARRQQTASGDGGSQRPQQEQGPVTIPGHLLAASLALTRGFVPAGTQTPDLPLAQGLVLPRMPRPAMCPCPACPRCHRTSQERRQSCSFSGETLNEINQGLHHHLKAPLQDALCLLSAM